MVHRLIKSCKSSRWDSWLLSLNCTEKFGSEGNPRKSSVFQLTQIYPRQTKALHKFKRTTRLWNIPNFKQPKTWQAITKLQISAHKLPIEMVRYDQKKQTERICPLCCEVIGNVTHYIFECKNRGDDKSSQWMYGTLLQKLKWFGEVINRKIL